MVITKETCLRILGASMRMISAITGNPRQSIKGAAQLYRHVIDKSLNHLVS